MSDRFFATIADSAHTASVDGPEAHHLAHVMRRQVGDEVTLFDGSGREFQARVERIGRSQVDLAILSAASIDRELTRQLTLGVALPKGDRQRWLVEKLTELGVASLVPLETQRGVAQPVEKARQRLERAVIEASKQCGRNRLMQIEPASTWAAFLERRADCRLLAHPTAAGMNPADLPARIQPATAVLAAIGPEGGFTDKEIAQAQAAGWQPVQLGHSILRVETAAVTLAALMHAAAAKP